MQLLALAERAGSLDDLVSLPYHIQHELREIQGNIERIEKLLEDASDMPERARDWLG
jgi:hypothetical protein